MAFRDETEALRARVRMLESDLAEAERRLAELDDVRVERDRLTSRVGELEGELAKLRPPPRAAPAPPRNAARAGPRRPKVVAAVAGVLVLGGVVYAFSATSNGIGLFLDGIDTDGAPTAGMVALADHANPPPLAGQVTGAYAASELEPGCRGYVATQPLLVLRATEPTAVRLSTRSSIDTVLVIVDALGGVHCDDDSGGSSNAALSIALGPGDHRVWVGTYHEDASASFELLVSASPVSAMPDPTGIATEGEPTLGTIEPREEETAHSFAGETEGFVAASQISASCRGFLPIAPHAVIRLREPRIVRVTTIASADLVMLVRSAGGTVRCDDDGAGSLQPLVTAVLPAGVHRVWVGAFRDGERGSFELSVTTRSPRGPIDAHGLATGGAPRLGRFALDGPPLDELSDIARGLVPTSDIATGCSGFVQSEPDLELSVDAARDVTLTPAPDGQLELLIEHPDHTFTCAQGILRATWRPGAYRVWVGVRGAGATTPFTLVATSEAPSVTPFQP